MTVYKLPYPKEFADEVRGRLWRLGNPGVHALAFDDDHKRCAAWCAHHYEITVSYSANDGPLNEVERKLAEYPGCYATTQWHPYREPDITNPDWPERRVRYLRRAQRIGDNGAYVRPRVFALIADPEDAA
ncbi:hypothetical protein [Mycobacterium sp.]|uniref:hypothetical protein n=1 Tax=Mycobacterium sp. TaxID=1785 RepID=UPI002C581427|nr:hypothetical protein [Mycobacterium sp.]HTY31005.1 hypothetical protein [Mycobacterium sp.]HUO37774.1 hypothetical protein [Mycobacterium sp.]